jgi:hypothetical protein
MRPICAPIEGSLGCISTQRAVTTRSLSFVGARTAAERTRRFNTPEEAEDFERGRAASPPATETQGPRQRAAARRRPRPRRRRPHRAQLEAQLRVQDDAEGPRDAVLSYTTKRDTRYGFEFRQSDGTSSTRRGFIGRRAAREGPASRSPSVAARSASPARASRTSVPRLSSEALRPGWYGTSPSWALRARRRLVPRRDTAVPG